jgi:hypothetical protein
MAKVRTTARTKTAKPSLEQRIRAIEDRLEIYNLISAHPPSADTGAREYTTTVWTKDGVFDRGPQLTSMPGRDGPNEGVESPGHQAAIRGGIAHFTGLPHIRIAGDTAVVTSYLQIVVPQTHGEEVDVPNHGKSRGFRVHRMTANRWELVRTTRGWKIKQRTLRLCDGSEPARQLLRRALEPMATR